MSELSCIEMLLVTEGALSMRCREIYFQTLVRVRSLLLKQRAALSYLIEGEGDEKQALQYETMIDECWIECFNQFRKQGASNEYA